MLTLHGKALESERQNSILNDHYAAQAIQQIDFDFSRFRLSRNAVIALAIRAKVLDQWTEQFLGRYKQANVVHIGCGLDSRYFRLNPSAEVAWWEVDYPEVISLREKIYQQRPGYRQLGTNILGEDWLKEIRPDVPTMVVAEGVLPYFTEEAATMFLAYIVSHFNAGQIAFDAYNCWGVRWLNQLPIMRQTHEKLHWAVDDPRRLETDVPQMRLRVENTNGIPEFVQRAGFWTRTAFRMSRRIAPLRRMGQLLLYDFGHL
ncbi:class I SAM-dependent methyltransferase [Bremerella alba]|uniref:class I SAM-dependent methyltransferase n=1 Tax=Bremerella alba TaxID=980252 RepID=UPI001A954BD1|nr:class I SAM-dependent methyltransferase [Bremerella alba]